MSNLVAQLPLSWVIAKSALLDLSPTSRTKRHDIPSALDDALVEFMDAAASGVLCDPTLVLSANRAHTEDKQTTNRQRAFNSVKAMSDKATSLLGTK
jgi:hypothetical protein